MNERDGRVQESVPSVNGVLEQPCVVPRDGQRRLFRRGHRALPLGRVAPVVAASSGGQGQLEALLEGGPRQTAVCKFRLPRLQ